MANGTKAVNDEKTDLTRRNITLVKKVNSLFQGVEKMNCETGEHRIVLVEKEREHIGIY